MKGERLKLNGDLLLNDKIIRKTIFSDIICPKCGQLMFPLSWKVYDYIFQCSCGYKMNKKFTHDEIDSRTDKIFESLADGFLIPLSSKEFIEEFENIVIKFISIYKKIKMASIYNKCFNYLFGRDLSIFVQKTAEFLNLDPSYLYPKITKPPSSNLMLKILLKFLSSNYNINLIDIKPNHIRFFIETLIEKGKLKGNVRPWGHEDIDQIHSDEPLIINKCYKCGEKIHLNLQKCENCNTLLLCPQCNNPVTGNWKRCTNCLMDLDYGRIKKDDGIGLVVMNVILPIIFLIIGFNIPFIDMFSFHRFTITEIINDFFYSPDMMVFLVWHIVYFLLNLMGATFFLRKGKNEFKEYGILFSITCLFTLISFFFIWILGVFLIGTGIFSFIYLMGSIEVIIKYSRIPKNRKKYLKKQEVKKVEDKLDLNNAKKSILGMIKSEQQVVLDNASQILNLDQDIIKKLIYELVGEDKIKGRFQKNIFIKEE